MTAAVDLPGNCNVDSPLSETVGGTGVSNETGSTVTVVGGPVTINVPPGGASVDFPASSTIPATVVAAGTSPGSAGDVTKCNAPFVLEWTINEVLYYVSLFTQNT